MRKLVVVRGTVTWMVAVLLSVIHIQVLVWQAIGNFKS